MKYRIKEVVENGKTYYYPQKKKRWFWRRFVWWGGEDGTTPHTVFYDSMAGALREIEDHKEYLKEKAVEKPAQTIFHYVD